MANRAAQVSWRSYPHPNPHSNPIPIPNPNPNQDVPEYKELVNYWMENRYTLRYTGGLVPDVCQQFTKKMGVFSNPTSKSSPAKIRLAFEAPPFAT